jgi:protein-L-isoaspartate(D-aspartate) O-methyltransferase
MRHKKETHRMTVPSEEMQAAWRAARERMVELIESRGVTAPRVITAMLRAPREQFVPAGEYDRAYDDRPLLIGHGQTISQPYIVAYMVEALGLKGGEKVLEVGAGSGYAAAVLAEMGTKVFAIERIEALVEQARANLRAAGYDTVNLICGDGSQGWAAEAPFDAILVSAGANKMPGPLIDQLAIGGRMVIPVGARPSDQELIRVTRVAQDDVREERLCGVRFVPLIEDGASSS